MAQANNGGITLPMLQESGRDRGPDFVLNVIKTPFSVANAAVDDIINANSSITEVLNIVAYLTMSTADRANNAPPAPGQYPWYNEKHSVRPVATCGTTDPATGFYTNAAPNVLDNSLFSSVGAAGQILYDLDAMAVVAAGAAAGGDFIPVCIRKRAAPALAAPGAVANTAVNPTGNFPAAAAANPLVISLMSDCVKQMINILENTRNIFGPKGWTTLFNQVKGGGSRSNHAKRTHRQHRRKYSSKHY